MPREMSSGESSPPYEPSHPATASTSTPIEQKISFAITAPCRRCGTNLLPAVVEREAMCVLCNVLLNEHWAEQDGGRRARVFRVQLLNRVLAFYGLRLDDWSGRVWVLRDREGPRRGRRRPRLALGRGRAARRPDARPARPGARGGAVKIPVALVTGFLGSGKTTLLTRLLGAPGHGRDGGDRERARRGRHRPPPAATRRRAHGAAGERLPLLRAPRRPRGRAARPARPPRLPARSPRSGASSSRRRGSPNPAPIVSTLLSEPLVKHHYRLEAVVTTVDAQHGLRHHESVSQAAAADRLVVTKTDVADPARRDGAAAAAEPGGADPGGGRSATSRPRRCSAARERDPRDLVYDDSPEHAHEVRALCVTFDEPLDWTAFGIWLTMLLQARGEDVLRVKGLLDVGAEGPLVLNGVQHVVHPPEHLAGVAGRGPPLAPRLHRPGTRAAGARGLARGVQPQRPALPGVSPVKSWPCAADSVCLGPSSRARRALMSFGASAGILARRASSTSVLPSGVHVEFFAGPAADAA